MLFQRLAFESQQVLNFRISTDSFDNVLQNYNKYVYKTVWHKSFRTLFSIRAMCTDQNRIQMKMLDKSSAHALEDRMLIDSNMQRSTN